MPSDTQLAARFPTEIVERLDQMVAEGRFDSRAAAVRDAVMALLDGERRRLEGETIAEAYRRTPQTDEEVAGAMASARAMIAEEPW
ncbi:MAG: ribbon-helix-helix domain-containing protein [Euzebya sp.]